MQAYDYLIWAPTEDLYHHGIKGQKWGDRNGPPYPLDSSDHSAAEKKASGGSSRSYSDSKKKRMTKAAVKVLKQNIKTNTDLANAAQKAGDKQWSQAVASGAKGNSEKEAKLTKSAEQIYEAGINFQKKADSSAKMLKDIESGTLQAGRDFITESKISTNVALDAIGLLNVKKTTSIKRLT